MELPKFFALRKKRTHIRKAEEVRARVCVQEVHRTTQQILHTEVSGSSRKFPRFALASTYTNIINHRSSSCDGMTTCPPRGAAEKIEQREAY